MMHTCIIIMHASPSMLVQAVGQSRQLRLRRPPTRRPPRKTDNRDRRSAAELFNAETHGVSGLVELPAGRMPHALHEICIGCASLPPSSSFLLHVLFVSLASSGIVSPPAVVTLRIRHNTPPQRPPPPHGACDSSCVTWGQCGQLYSRSEMHDLKCERQQLPSSSWSLFHFWVGLKRGAQ